MKYDPSVRWHVHFKRGNPLIVVRALGECYCCKGHSAVVMADNGVSFSCDGESPAGFFRDDAGEGAPGVRASRRLIFSLFSHIQFYLEE